MPNVNTVLKDMICRLARKEIKTQTVGGGRGLSQSGGQN